MARSHSFGSMTYYSLALFTLAFASAPSLQLNLAIHHNSPALSTKSTRSPVNGLSLLVGIWFQDLFTPIPGFFSPFPHGTSSLSVTYLYLAFRDGPRGFNRGSTCPDLLRCLLERTCFQLLDSHHLRYDFPIISSSIYLFSHIEGPTTPEYMYSGLGSSHSARRYFGNHFYFLFLQVLRCFTSLGLALPCYVFT